jgi:hypothetical protein
VILVEFTTVNEADAVPSFTEVAPRKFEPLIVTKVPARPTVGVKLVILGGGGFVTVNVWVLTAVPSEFVTEILPVVALIGTVAVIFVSEFTAYVAAAPLNFTALVPVKPLPLIVTAVPGGPLDGKKLEIDGGWTAVPQVGNWNEPTRVCQFADPVVWMYSVVYQNVQSSVGSGWIEL